MNYFIQGMRSFNEQKDRRENRLEMTYDRPLRKKVMIASISPGYPEYCPKCNSTRVVLFYDPRFTPRLQSKWDKLIVEKRIILENRWEQIKGENQWGTLEKDSEKPNWICKDCYDGGVLLEVTK